MERARRRAHNKLNTHYERAKGRLKQLLTQEHHRPRHRSLSQLHQDLNEVDLDQVREVATRVYTRPPLLALTGPFEPDHTF